MKNAFKVFAIVAVIGFSFAASSDGGEGGEGGGGAPPPVTIDGDFIGTWTGIMSDGYGTYVATITVTNTTWTQYEDGYYYDSGYFTSWDGTSGNIYSNYYKAVVGTVTVINATQARIVLRAPSEGVGTYTLTKTSS